MSKSVLKVFSFAWSLGILLTFLQYRASAQAGLTVSPSRIYFSPKDKKVQHFIVTNPNKDKNVEVGISLNDWNYDSIGNNVVVKAGSLASTCAQYIVVQPGTYFTLAPEESKEVTISMNSSVPESTDSIPVRTAMLYMTQLNPGDGKDENGASIKVTVRIGVKIYYTSIINPEPDIDIEDLKVLKVSGDKKVIQLKLNNTGNKWVEGNIKYQFLNKETGEKINIEPDGFFSLPRDRRIFNTPVSDKLTKGKYTLSVIVSYGNDDEVKIAELDYENS